MKTKQHQITLDLAPGILETLKAKAATGKTLEEFISDFLNKAARRALKETLSGKESSK